MATKRVSPSTKSRRTPRSELLRLARSPSLSAAQCADVLHFMHYSEPIDLKGWWKDPPSAPSHVVGYYILLTSLERSLRKGGAA